MLQEYILLRNFILILSDEPNALASFREIVLLPEAEMPAPLDLPSLDCLCPYLGNNKTVLLNLAQLTGVRLFFIEQKLLPENRPPRLPPFMVSCEFRGVISLHDSEAEARLHWLNYKRDGLAKGDFPEAQVHGWFQDQWKSTHPG